MDRLLALQAFVRGPSRPPAGGGHGSGALSLGGRPADLRGVSLGVDHGGHPSLPRIQLFLACYYRPLEGLFVWPLGDRFLHRGLIWRLRDSTTVPEMERLPMRTTMSKVDGYRQDAFALLLQAK